MVYKSVPGNLLNLNWSRGFLPSMVTHDILPESQLAGAVKMFLPSFCLLICWIGDSHSLVSFDSALDLRSWISLVMKPGRYHSKSWVGSGYSVCFKNVSAPAAWFHQYFATLTCILFFSPTILKTPAPFSGVVTILQYVAGSDLAVVKYITLAPLWVRYLTPYVHSGCWIWYTLEYPKTNWNLNYCIGYSQLYLAKLIRPSPSQFTDCSALFPWYGSLLWATMWEVNDERTLYGWGL